MTDRRVASNAARRGSLPTEPTQQHDHHHHHHQVGEGNAPNGNATILPMTATTTTTSNIDQTRLDHIFAMLSILESNDETMLRRLEAELLRVDADQMRLESDENERDTDAALLDPLNRHDELQQLLAALSGADRREDRAEVSANDDDDDDDVGHNNVNDDDDDDDGNVGDPDEQLLLPNGLPLTVAHIDVISDALDHARVALNIATPEIAHERRGRTRHRQEDISTQTECDQEERGDANDVESDRERDGDREQIEGYEGDRRAQPQPPQQQQQQQPMSPSSPESIQETDPRVRLIMETLRAFADSDLGAEELDEFVLQSVLQIHGGPSRDSNGAHDHIGDEQMRLYQECIAVIDDFLDIVAMINEEDDDVDVDDDGANER